MFSHLLPSPSLLYKKTYFLLSTSTVVLLFLPVLAQASGGIGGGLPYESLLIRLTASLTGPVAFAFGIIGVVASGAGLIFGAELSSYIRMLLVLTFVISTILGAPTILALFFGRGAEIVSILQTDPTYLLAQYIPEFIHLPCITFS